MENAYFEMLDETSRTLVLEIESHLNGAIEIEVDTSRTDTLACTVKKNGPIILTPNANHFPSASVFHELLHIRRFCVNSEPKIVVCDSFVEWTDKLEDCLKELDNNIEHFIIVPEECEKYKDRINYWVTMVVTAIKIISNSKMEADEKERQALLYWAFSKHVLNGSEAENISNSLIEELSLKEKATSFLSEINTFINEKDKLVRVFFNHLNLKLDIGCLNYIDCINNKTREEALPEL